MASSQRTGMGAIPYAGGVTFRVWAPFASSVCVAGTFNGWAPAATRLFSEEDGYWSVDVDGSGVGDQYKFTLVNRDDGLRRWKNDPYARSLTNAAGNSIVAETDDGAPTPGYSTPPWNAMVLYELHVGSFSFDHGSGGGRGNFSTVIARLDDLADLGINAIQLMPSDEFPGDVSWGYNPAYIFAIEEKYGGPNGLRRLVDAAQSRGIAVLFDVVYNHLGPDDLDLWQFDGWNQDGWGGIYFFNDWPRRHTDWGDTRPDYGRGEVRRYIRDNALRWLEERRCDGLRWDATGWIRNASGHNDDPSSDIPEGWSLMQWINAEARERQPWKLMIAEDMQDNDWLTKPAGEGGAGFGAQWGAAFVHTLRRELTQVEDRDRDLDRVRDVLEQRFNADAFQRVVYLESHDEVAASAGKVRLPEAIWPGHADSYASQKRSTLGAALVLTAPGIPMIFMGQEFLEWGAWSDGVEMDWSKAERFAGIRCLYRDLIRLRRNWYDTTRGLQGQHVNVHHVNGGDKVLAFHRWDRGGPRDDVVIVANFADTGYDSYRVGLPRAGLWRVRFNGDARCYSPVFTDRPSRDLWARPESGVDDMPCAGDVGLGPYCAVFLSQDD